MSTPVDVVAVSSRLASAYLFDRNDGDALMRAMGDVRQLLHEVERLRADGGTALRGQLVLALMDAEQAQQALAEATRKVDELRDTVDGLCTQLERARAEVSYLRACVPPVHPRDYGHEAWAEAVRAAVEAERAAVVAWLRACANETPSATTELWFASDEVEVGAHRRDGGA